MTLGPPTVVGLDAGPYEAWLWRHLLRVVALRTEPGVAVCWGAAAPPAGARAVVRVPKDPNFLSHPEALRVQASDPIAADLASWFGWLVSRAEEYEPFEADALGRFPRAAALAQRLGLMEEPVADLLALRLRTAIEAAAGAAGLAVEPDLPWPDGKRFAVCLTHDVDHATRRSLWQGAQLAAGAAASALGGRWAQARRRLDAAAGLARGGRHSPDWLFEPMAELEAARGLRSAFYLLPYESDWAMEGGRRLHYYDVRRPEVLETFRRLAAEGWEIGLHTSYDAHDRPDGLGRDWRRLAEILGPAVPMTGGRSHCLRFRTPETWRQAEACGIGYDATLAWPEGSGFRCGTAWPHRPFDRQAGREVALWEFGTHLMDTYLPSLDALVAKAREVCDRVARTGGCACLLAHPTTPRQAQATVRGFLRAYAAILDDLKSRPDVWVATPREVIARLATA